MSKERKFDELKTAPSREEKIAAEAAWRLKDGRGGTSMFDAAASLPWINSAKKYFPGSGYEQFEREFVGSARARSSAREILDASRSQLLEIARMRVEDARKSGFDLSSLGVDSNGDGKLDATIVEPSVRSMVERTHPEGSRERESLNTVGPSGDLPRIVSKAPGAEALVEWVLGPESKAPGGNRKRQSAYSQFPGDGRLIEDVASELSSLSDPSDPSRVREALDRRILERFDGILFAKTPQDQAKRGALLDEVASFKAVRPGEVHPTVKAACSMVAPPGAGFDACSGFLSRAFDGERKSESARREKIDRESAEGTARATAMAKERCEQAGKSGSELNSCVEKLSASSVEEFRKKAADQKAQDPVDRAYARFRRD